MADEKKIDTKDRDKRYMYTENDVKSLFQYAPTKNSNQKIEKK